MEKNTTGTTLVNMDAAQFAENQTLCVWPRQTIPGWSGSTSGTVRAMPRVTLREAIETRFNSDAHAVGYSVVRSDGKLEPEQPRLNKSALRALQEQGSDVLMNLAFVDVDNPNHARWSVDEASEFLDNLLDDYGQEGGPLEHAIAHTTRGGYRLIFVLDTPIPANKYQSWYMLFVNWLVEATDEIVEPDETAKQWTRCFRLPNVLRFDQNTDTDVQTESVVTWGSGQRFNSAQWLDEAEEASYTGSTSSASCAHTARPSAYLPLSTEELKATTLMSKLKCVQPKLYTCSLYEAIIKGCAFFGPSERDNATFRAVADISDALAEDLVDGRCVAPDPMFIYRALAPSIEDACERRISGTPVAEALDKLWLSCERRHTQAKGDAIQKQRQLDIYNAKKEKTAEYKKEDKEAPTKAVAEAIREQTDIIGMILQSADDGDDEPAVGQRKLSPEDHRSLAISKLPPIAFAGNGWYILNLKDPENPVYSEGYRKEIHAMKALYDSNVVNLTFENEKGKTKKLPFSYLYNEHGTQCREVVHVLGGKIPECEDDILFLPCAQPRPCPAIFHQDIADWLELLGGDDPEALRIWLATLLELDRPTAALYLQGAPGTGKGLLVSGLNSLWGANATPFEVATGRFNFSLKKNPLVFLDESVSTSRSGNRDLSGDFRSLVTDTQRTIEPKGLEMVSLEGCVRVIVAANNPDAISMSGATSQEDIDAIVTRIRHIDVDPRAKDLLGFENTEGWVKLGRKPGKIAQHVMWLVENHPRPTTGIHATTGRLLVPGVAKDYHAGLVLTEEREEVLFAVLQSITSHTHRSVNNHADRPTLTVRDAREHCEASVVRDPKTKEVIHTGNREQMRQLLRGSGGDVLVSVAALMNDWKKLTFNSPLPRASRINRALGVMSQNELFSIGKSSFFRIPRGLIISTNNKLRTVSPEHLEKILKH